MQEGLAGPQPARGEPLILNYILYKNCFEFCNELTCLVCICTTWLLCIQVEDTDEHIKTTIKAGGLMDVVSSQDLITLPRI